MTITSRRGAPGRFLAVAFCLTLTTGLCWALTAPEEGSGAKTGADLKAREFFLPELYVSSSHQHLDQVLAQLPNRVAWENFQAARERAGKGRLHAFIDPRSGAATNMIDAESLIPGKGVGNQVTLAELGRRFGYKVAQVGPPELADAVVDFVGRHRQLLGVDMNQLGDPEAVRVSDELWQVSVPQTHHGIPVRHGRLVATINNGNLVLVGTETWGQVRGLSPVPLLNGEDAMAIGFEYADGRSPGDEIVLEPTLEVVPVAPEPGPYRGPVGQGYGHRLVWSFQFRRAPEMATWEVLVDAHGGEVISFQDVNDYGTITGGVYPVTSTEICPTPGTCGVMQSGWPMPWADTGLLPPDDEYTNSGGVFNGSGPATTTLSGLYVDITDYCGPISNGGSASIDLGGTNGDHDCTSGGGSAGNTAASRTAFYEVNKLMEMARGWLPDNTWLQQPLTTRVNLNQTCNAYYYNNTINFYRSGGGCRNTGELAGVFDHEWGHGLDYHDTNGTISYPGEAYADIAEIYRIQHSCVGHGFFWTYNHGCGMTSDGTGYNADEAQVGAAHCDLDCSGVRDADWDMHADHTPDTPLNFVCPACYGGPAPCGRQVHCAAAPIRQAAWDFVVRDLQSAPFYLDNQTAFIIGNKVFYQGSGNVGNWHACTCGVSSDGCGATHGYMQWLAADDDDGNLTNGTPHMTALHDAFNRHEIACATPTPTNSGCAGGPTGTATLSAVPGDNQVALAWTAVSGAGKYWVFRTEGHAGCDYNKVLIAETTDLAYTDTEVANGREYYYNVVAVGTSDACFGPVSNCATVTPRSPIIWVDAGGLGDYVDLQSAVDAAVEGDEIRVVQGVYTTASGDVVTWVAKDLTLQGGYESVGGALEPGLYETVIDGAGVAFRSGVYTSGLTSASTFSGFTLTGGQNGRLNSGAGIHNDQSDLVISHCVFHSNSANWGAGVASWNDSDVVITHSYFHSNWAYYGAGIHNGSGSEATIVNCVFHSNSAAHGGAIRNVSSNAAITNCSFGGNSAAYGKTMANRYSEPTVLNSILWNGGDEIDDGDGLASTVTYSDVQGGYPGLGNIDADPLFYNVAAGDLRLRFLSPAIDKGTDKGAPEDDILGRRRPQGLGIDMGAYEMRALIPEPY